MSTGIRPSVRAAAMRDPHARSALHNPVPPSKEPHARTDHSRLDAELAEQLPARELMGGGVYRRSPVNKPDRGTMRRGGAGLRHPVRMSGCW
jgi:hypothetical protein